MFISIDIRKRAIVIRISMDIWVNKSLYQFQFISEQSNIRINFGWHLKIQYLYLLQVKFGDEIVVISIQMTMMKFRCLHQVESILKDWTYYVYFNWYSKKVIVRSRVRVRVRGWGWGCEGCEGEGEYSKPWSRFRPC